MQTPQTKPNGPVAAAFIAAGVGSFAMGLFVVLNEISTDVNNFLRWDANYGLGSGVGPLSGKAGMAIVAYLVSWAILHLALRGKEVRWNAALTAALILVALGFLLTFPPVFEILAETFAPAEA
jgi:lysylphosphatidylglycerol synthetase-like protein (DUF2156 family)